MFLSDCIIWSKNNNRVHFDIVRCPAVIASSSSRVNFSPCIYNGVLPRRASPDARLRSLKIKKLVLGSVSPPGYIYFLCSSSLFIISPVRSGVLYEKNWMGSGIDHRSWECSCHPHERQWVRAISNGESTGLSFIYRIISRVFFFLRFFCSHSPPLAFFPLFLPFFSQELMFRHFHLRFSYRGLHKRRF